MRKRYGCPVFSSTRQSDNAVTTVEYLSGNKKRVTDAEGNATTTTYLAYGSPSYNKPTLIEAPDTSDTSIAYNKFGQVESITQGSVTEKRLYDGYQQLCKTYRPETGVTAYGYNAQRQPIWRAEGTNGGSNSCAASSVPASHKVLLGYDNLGQLSTENFPDATPDNRYRYDANGNLASLVSGSGSRAISWSYLYNSLNLIEKETLSMDSKNFVLDWGYNSLGAVSSLKYPSGRSIYYSPNALGQPTKASEGTSAASINYASNVKYHPNGQLKQLTYGNGIVRKVSLDTTGRIDAISDKKNTTRRLDLDPSYDSNDNLSRLIDRVDRKNDIDNLSYDGVNRLKSADGRWGKGNYSYDGLGNILNRSISGSSITYHYNSLNRLNKLSGAYAYTYGYDTRGNVKHNGRYGLEFNRANQMTAAKTNTYRYDGHNRKVAQNKSSGMHHYIYSQAGKLLHRRKPDGKKAESIYLGAQIIAEVGDGLDALPDTGTPTEPPNQNLPSLYLAAEHSGSGSGGCPKGQKCPTATIGSRIVDNYRLSWISNNATNCAGNVKRNGVVYMNLSGLIHIGIVINDDSAIYHAAMTCTGSGGQVTKSVTFGGSGNGDEF
ncbi:hypothetical protein [Shewanella sp.]|uniref:RHS repeat domain-containing protein n=1 Tax=Shewanella sp. TaxID=50422 RepID=UPI001ED5B786|nr:hypothetical protein [Shewanella sp.]NRB25753.1 RHS repeat protein [Shewanella sp.]